MTSPPTIDFRVAPQLAELLQRVRRYVEEEALPAEARLSDPGDADALWATVQQLRETARERGLYTPQLPKAWGGLDVGELGMALICQECGSSALALLGLHAMAPDDATMHTLLHAGTSDQHERFLRPLISGQARSCFAMTEPDSAGSDPTNITTTAVRDGEDWVLNGQKWLITGAAYATFAIVVAKTTQRDPVTHHDFSLLLVPTEAPGWQVVHQPSLLAEHLPGGHAQIALRDVRVPAENLLGHEGEGFQVAQQRLARGRLMHAMRWIGLAQLAVDLAARRVTQRHAFGRELAEHQAIQHFLADSAIDLYASRLMVLHCAWKVEQRLPHRQEISIVKTFVAEAFGRIMDRVVQIFGSHAIATDQPIAHWWAQARAARITDGPSEVHRMVIAREMLKLARDNTSTRPACGELPSPASLTAQPPAAAHASKET
jgi:acyl-CoA dehydrogenase